MNRKIRQLAAGLMALFVLLFVAMNYWQVGRASDVNGMADNTRALRREFGQPRGEIISADGVVVARSVPTPEGSAFPLMRDYPTGPLFADVTGYYSFAFGSTQLEFTQNDVLTGETGRQIVGNLQDVVTGGDGTGSVLLTMRNDLQDEARNLLDGRAGGDRDARHAGRRAGDVRQPHVRPQQRRQRRLRARPVDVGGAERGRGPAAARQRLPAALHARVGVQGDHDGRRARRRCAEPGLAVRPRHVVDAAADERSDPELQRLELRWRPRRGVPAQLQHPVRPDRARTWASTG